MDTETVNLLICLGVYGLLGIIATLTMYFTMTDNEEVDLVIFFLVGIQLWPLILLFGLSTIQIKKKPKKKKETLEEVYAKYLKLKEQHEQTFKESGIKK